MLTGSCSLLKFVGSEATGSLTPSVLIMLREVSRLLSDQLEFSSERNMMKRTSQGVSKTGPGPGFTTDCSVRWSAS